LRSSCGSRLRELDRDGIIPAEQACLALDENVQRLTFLEEVALLIMGELDQELPPAEAQREGELVPGVQQPGREGQPAVEVADAAEPEDERRPYAGGRGKPL
jgi:hypothetical protein